VPCFVSSKSRWKTPPSQMFSRSAPIGEGLHPFSSEMPQKCQVHANLIYASPTELHNQTTPWSFAVYCLDIIGRLTRRWPIGHEYILVALDSFTKWDKNLLYHDHSGTRHNISEEAASPHKLRNVNAVFRALSTPDLKL
jgi:hypothetical protein